MLAPVDMTFELLHRRGATDDVVTMWSEHFDPASASFAAQLYSKDMAGKKVDFADGDKLVFRFTAANTIESDSWIPNGDGQMSQGRVPNFTLPQ